MEKLELLKQTPIQIDFPFQWNGMAETNGPCLFQLFHSIRMENSSECVFVSTIQFFYSNDLLECVFVSTIQFFHSNDLLECVFVSIIQFFHSNGPFKKLTIGMVFLCLE